MHACEGTCGHVLVHTCVCACMHTYLCEREREVEGVLYFSLQVLIFTPVDHSMTIYLSVIPCSITLLLHVSTLYNLSYICFTWS